jgi:hypothetical protein
MNDTVTIDMTFAQLPGYGHQLGRFLYSGSSLKRRKIDNNLFDLLDRDQWTGCPHDGGEHSFRLHKMPRDDARAWIVLWTERYGNWPQTDYILEQIDNGAKQIRIRGAKYWEELRT